jgi:hypothetical protein
MPRAQYVEAFQKQLETGNSLIFGLFDPLTGALGFPIGANLGSSKSTESVLLLTLFNFQRTVCRVYKILGSTPTDF